MTDASSKQRVIGFGSGGQYVVEVRAPIYVYMVQKAQLEQIRIVAKASSERLGLGSMMLSLFASALLTYLGTSNPNAWQTATCIVGMGVCGPLALYFLIRWLCERNAVDTMISNIYKEFQDLIDSGQAEVTVSKQESAWTSFPPTEL